MRTMNRAARLFGLVLCLATSTRVARAQVISAASAESPIQPIDISQFNQMTQSGQLTIVDPAALHQAVVQKFIQENPNLPGFARLVERTPTNPDVVPTADGNYQIQFLNREGILETVETMGHASTLADAANSIQAASDPVQQLGLYTSFYSQYAALYDQYCTASPVGVVTPCTNLPRPSTLTTPAVLQNASLGELDAALHALGSVAVNLGKLVPPILSSGLASCSGDIGNDSALTGNPNYGDQTRNTAACAVPYPFGILANFDWPNKDMLTCVKKQGSRGTCHIFAATSAVEEMVAIETGKHVNLSEQDFQEHEKLIWGPAPYGDSGDSRTDLGHAAAYGYTFAYEDQWDYNPSYGRTQPVKGELFVHSCDDYVKGKLAFAYPYPGSEPGCSDASSQAPEFCAFEFSLFSPGSGLPSATSVCGFAPAVLPGKNSPYTSNGANSIWHFDDKTMSVGKMISSLMSNEAVILALVLTPEFNGKDGYITYDPSDAIPCPSSGPCPNHAGSHSVHVVGYIDNTLLATNSATKTILSAKAPHEGGATVEQTNGGGYFIIKNSWDNCAGDAGYYYMPVAYLEARAIAVYVVPSVGY